ncbi:MAG: YjbQ family protein [Chloroflexi bacterium]|nr:YjbQ family protein [Chloroflexota bacterium]
MTVYTHFLHLDTKGDCDFADLTEPVMQALGESGLRDGVVTIFTPSSTSALTTIEYEPGALADLKRFFDQVAPQFGQEYRHNLRWGDGNGHSHLRAAILGPSLAIPFVSGRLTLGTWQQILFVDFDVRPRQRRIVLQFVGQ